MKITSPLLTFVLSTFLMLPSALCSAAPKPTIIVFLSDDHGMLDSTPYGSSDVRTPHMQRLADAGMTFTHAFIASASCAPSRAAMLAGLMAARNGAEANHTFKRDDVASLPEVMRKLGYETAAFVLSLQRSAEDEEKQEQWAGLHGVMGSGSAV